MQAVLDRGNQAVLFHIFFPVPKDTQERFYNFDYNPWGSKLLVHSFRSLNDLSEGSWIPTCR